MADYTFASGQAAQLVQMERMIADMRVCFPGIIKSFDAVKQRVSVVPAVRMKVTLPDQVIYVDMPEIINVPIVIPYGYAGGLMITFPINANDPCLLIFSDRALDNFLQTGAQADPIGRIDEQVTAPRAHDLTDAICIPGLIADPQKIASWNNNAIEIRNSDRSVYISLTAANVQTQGDVTANGKLNQTGNVTLTGNLSVSGDITAQGKLTVTGNITSSGTITDGMNIQLATHKHSGVQTGSGTSGPAVP